LPEPPFSDQTISEMSSSKIETITSSSLSGEQGFSSILEDKIEDVIDTKERDDFIATRKSLLNELDGIFKQGFDGTLKHASEDEKKENVDYNEIKKRNYLKAVKDYEAAGNTLADSELYSNASISYGCMILGKFLATNSLTEMYDEFQKIIEKIQHKQIIRSSFFSILTQLFEAIAIKDKKGILRQLEKLKLIETFSTDDQELIADSIDAITNLFSN
jgi:hypothetical protein